MEYDEPDIENLNYFKEMVELIKFSMTLPVYMWSRDKDVSDKTAIEKSLNCFVMKLSPNIMCRLLTSLYAFSVNNGW